MNIFTRFIKSVTGINTTKMALIVRTDLKMSAGKIASQCAHAAVSLYESALKSNNAHMKTWLRTGQPKIVLRIDKDCEQTLRKYYEIAQKNGLNACLIYDAGKTQLQPSSLTVLGIGPNLSTDIDKITSKLKLL